MNLKRTILAGSIALLGLAGASQAAFVPVNGNIVTNTRWTRNNVYILNRVIFVEPGVTLTIEPGTIIRGIKASSAGSPGSEIPSEPGALVVARGAKVVANATPDDPIVFTSIDDPNVIGGAATIPASFNNSLGTLQTVVPQNYSPDGATGTNGFAYNQQWGGLVILGNAYVANYNVGTPPTVDADSNGLPDEPHTLADATNTNVGGFGRDIIEGLDAGTIPSAGTLGLYGDKNDLDNSGVYRFVSCRYGGFKIGANNEINAITTGGTGRGTVMEFLEAAFNVDDGFEFFGGNMDTRHLYANYIMDDSFDADEGFRGTHQFWFCIQGTTTQARAGYASNNTTTGVTFTDTQYDRIFEVDGAENDLNKAYPRTDFDVYNLSIIGGTTTNNNVRIRLDALVDLNNVAARLTRAASAAPVENSPAAATPGITSANVNNFHTFPAPSNPDFNDGSISSVIVEGVSQFASGLAYTFQGTDPRLAAGVASLTEDGPLPPAGFVQVNYAGYQRNNTFLNGWSVLDYLDTLPATNVARPEVTIRLSGTNPVVRFDSAGSGIKYVIEKSTDRRTWAPINGGNTVSGSGTISFTDTSTTFTAGQPVYYRVYAL
jgi:hypothetical protein